VSFNSAKIEWTYTPRTDGGTLKLFDFKSRDRWDLPEPSTIVLCGIGAVALLAHAARASIWRRQPFTEPAARPSTIQRWMKT
jgi:hypothetical protein